MTRDVEIIEMAPRDGLQNERTILPTAEKLALIDAAVRAGLARVEVASFVNPARVPAMADAEAVFAGLAGDKRAAYAGLVLNARGLDRAIAAGAREICVVAAASDTFARRNQGMGRDVLASMAAETAARARQAGVKVTIALAVAFGCPFEGPIEAGRIERLIAAFAEARPDEVALADTIGVAAPQEVARLARAAASIAGAIPLRLHLHDTRNTGVANAFAGLDAGVTRFDAALGGMGGCPFAPGATGNVATEDLVYAFERSGVSTGIDLDAAIRAGRELSARLGKPVASGLGRAGAPVRAAFDLIEPAPFGHGVAIR
jgi:hydroxymethylglutaryl-CoA lyase